MTSNSNDIIQIQTGLSSRPDITPTQIGGKAHGLLRMAEAGIRIPPAFVLGTACCRQYFNNNNQLPDDLIAAIQNHIHWLENISGKVFGSKRNPLVISVRSGSPVSMPGMMESLLNIGITDETARGLITFSGNPRLVWDSYCRLLQNYAEVVHNVEPSEFDETVKNFLKQERLRNRDEMDSVTLKNLRTEFKHIFTSEAGTDFPQDPWQQLYHAIAAVFDSWFSKRAKTYRKINSIDDSSGTACLVQQMVFGNAGASSGSGVGFTRNPANGTNELYIDFLSNAQGENIVSGRYKVDDADTLQRKLPSVFSQLQPIREKLEKVFSDMQDFEFTVQQGELYLLQTRNGKRTPIANLRIVIELVDEGIITVEQALAMLEKTDLENLYSCQLKQSPQLVPVATGIIASTGVVTGMIALDEETAREYSNKGKPVVLVRKEISTSDIAAMDLADAVITITGGRTSHAAVVARQMGTVCVVGCHGLRIDTRKRCIYLGEQLYPEGSYLTVDADHGNIYSGQLEIEKNKPTDLLLRVKQWQTRQSKKVTATASG